MDFPSRGKEGMGQLSSNSIKAVVEMWLQAVCVVNWVEAFESQSILQEIKQIVSFQKLFWLIPDFSCFSGA